MSTLTITLDGVIKLYITVTSVTDQNEQSFVPIMLPQSSLLSS
jgi:hypothetical protein